MAKNKQETLGLDIVNEPVVVQTPEELERIRVASERCSTSLPSISVSSTSADKSGSGRMADIGSAPSKHFSRMAGR